MPLLTVVDERTENDESWTWLFEMCCGRYRGPISDYALMPDLPPPGERTEPEERAAAARARSAARPPTKQWEPSNPAHWK